MSVLSPRASKELRLEKLDGGWSARLQYGLIRMYGLASSVVGYRGAQRYTWLLSRLFNPENRAVVRHSHGRVSVFLNDGYWIRLLFPRYVYEPDIANVLPGLLRDGGFFLDGGANLGYWSLRAKQLVNASGVVVAIEPSERSFNRLIQNIEVNRADIHCLRAALFNDDDLSLNLVTHPLRHGGDSVTDDRSLGPLEEYGREEVTSITVDTVVRRFASTTEGNPIIKLDVEGSEIQSLDGAREAIDGGAIVLYEDHSSDLSCRVTNYVLNELEMSAFALQEAGPPVPLESAGQLRQLKLKARRNFNVLAHSRNLALAVDNLVTSAER